MGIASKAVWGTYYRLMKEFGTEFTVLRDAGEKQLMQVVDPKIAALILQNRRGEIAVDPGYDGEYGVPEIDRTVTPEQPVRDKRAKKQRTLGEF